MVDHDDGVDGGVEERLEFAAGTGFGDHGTGV
jgi:hypothetical protein